MKTRTSPTPKVIPRSIPSSTPANESVEFTLTARGADGDPFNQVVLDELITDPAGIVHRVPAFWAAA